MPSARDRAAAERKLALIKPILEKAAGTSLGDCIFSDWENWKNEWVAYGSRISNCDKGFLMKLRGESGWNFNHPSKVVIKAVYSDGVTRSGSNLPNKWKTGAKITKVLAREPSKGFCQIHRDYHPEMWADKRLWTEWKYQVETCYRLYKGGTPMYAKKKGIEFLVRKKP